MTIYSTQFALGTLSGTGPTTVYTVPAGHIAVVRCIDTLLGGVGVAPVSFAVNGNPPVIFLKLDPANTSNGAGYWRGYQVLNPGDTLDMNANFSGERYLISGYLLKLP